MDQGITWRLGSGKSECRLQQEIFGHLGFDFVVVCKSGRHLVLASYNQPVHALVLVTRFLQNKNILDPVLPSFDFAFDGTDNAGE
jgi:hypothetical protein